jgi:RNA polymerase sigma factor (sigma-70 family)
MDVHRRSKRQRLVVELDAEGVAAVDDHERVAVWAAVDELPPRQREVIYLRYRSDLSFDEIGHVLGITAGAARSHATQAMSSLRRTFRDEEVG